MENSQTLTLANSSIDVINLRQHHENILKMDQITIVVLLARVPCSMCIYCVGNIPNEGWIEEFDRDSLSCSSFYVSVSEEVGSGFDFINAHLHSKSIPLYLGHSPSFPKILAINSNVKFKLTCLKQKNVWFLRKMHSAKFMLTDEIMVSFLENSHKQRPMQTYIYIECIVLKDTGCW